jgi:glycosyltransferase involved in cell wall biosynthesis
VDVLLSPSHDLAARFASLGYRRPRWCPLPLTQPVPAAPPAPPGPVRFLFASSVIPTKGPHHLLSAFSRLPAGRATLTIAGHSPDFGLWPGFGESLRARAETTPGVTWLGGIPSSKIPALLHSHDVLVLASLWPENSPLTIREATAAGLPVITTTLGGARELASDARLVAPGDIPALVSALEACCARGRHRTRPHRWQTSDEHAIWMLDEVYRGVVSQ